MIVTLVTVVTVRFKLFNEINNFYYRKFLLIS